MVEGGFRGVVIGILLVGLFMFSLIAFVGQFQVENAVNETIMGEEAISKSFGNISYQLNKSSDTAKAQREAFEEEKGLVGIGFLLFTTIVEAGKTFISLSVGIFKVVGETSIKYLGIPPMVLGVITAVFLIIAILFAWRLYKVGS